MHTFLLQCNIIVCNMFVMSTLYTFTSKQNIVSFPRHVLGWTVYTWFPLEQAAVVMVVIVLTERLKIGNLIVNWVIVHKNVAIKACNNL